MDRVVKPITTKECLSWVLTKHYAKRKPRIQFAFGLYIESRLMGVITFGSKWIHLNTCYTSV